MATTINGYELSPINEITIQLGNLCFSWSTAEVTIDLALAIYMGLTHPGKRRDTILSNIPFRDKLKMIEALGYIYRADDGQFDDLRKQLNLIDNEYRLERNRMIHDPWISDSTDVYRWLRRTKISRPQARQIALETSEKTPIGPDEIFKLATNITITAANVLIIACFSHAPVMPEALPESNPLQDPGEYRLQEQVE